MTIKTKRVRIHRFKDYIAVYLDTGATAYLPPSLAHKLARVLQRFATDIQQRTFTSSSLFEDVIEPDEQEDLERATKTGGF